MNQISKILDEAVLSLSGLPGIGKKTALRLVLHMAQQDKERTKNLAASVNLIATDLKFCRNCFAYSDFEICAICSNPHRNSSFVCVVESVRDLFAIEETHSFKGQYHVLGGLISPLDGIGPDKINIAALFEKVRTGLVKEIILAIRPNIEGDTTAYYIHKNMPDVNVKLSMLARGVSFGSELEYADELTLSRSIMNRTPYQLTDNTSG
ncbi:MAG: recombination protein RecR [Saprospiraceae bacterium]|nr:recombination protein RecR [Saprospiraceae bacterium]